MAKKLPFGTISGLLIAAVLGISLYTQTQKDPNPTSSSPGHSSTIQGETVRVRSLLKHQIRIQRNPVSK